MGAKTKIEWTRGADGREGASWNPIRARNRSTGRVGWFCIHASEGCRNCYAETLNNRLGTGIAYAKPKLGEVEMFLDEKMLTLPLRWSRPRTIFVGSMTDLFGEFVTDGMIDRVLAVMALAAQHTFIVLTKRAERMRRYIENGDLGVFDRWPLPNVWLGVSVEDQAAADERIPLLLATPAAVRFLSCEPLLGPVDLTHIDLPGGHNEVFPLGMPEGREPYPRIDWVIVGGESGPHARPMHPDWARSLRDQCVGAGVPFFFKQWGQWHPDALLFTDMQGRNPPPNMKIGKEKSGRLLDGREWNESPITNRSAST